MLYVTVTFCGQFFPLYYNQVNYPSILQSSKEFHLYYDEV